MNVDTNALDRDGYLVLRDVVRRSVLDDIVAEYEGVLDRLVHRLHADGEITSTYDGLGFEERLIHIYRESGRAHDQALDFAIPPAPIPANTPFWTGPAVFRLLVDDDLLDCVEQVLGPEITSNPIQHNRIKPPDRVWGDPESVVTSTPIHQDTGVATADAAQTHMLTVWIPILDAPVERGVLAVLPGAHKLGLLEHAPGHGGLHVVDLPAVEPTLLPVARGDVIFVHRLLPHGSTPNVSDTIRWSFDLRYNPTGQPTGRAVLPDFVARSRANPASELRDPDAWNRLWLEARRSLSSGAAVPAPNRWSA